MLDFFVISPMLPSWSDGHREGGKEAEGERWAFGQTNDDNDDDDADADAEAAEYVVSGGVDKGGKTRVGRLDQRFGCVGCIRGIWWSQGMMPSCRRDVGREREREGWRGREGSKGSNEHVWKVLNDDE